MARRKRKRSSDEAPGWVWMLFGLGIGLIIALGVYLNTRTDHVVATNMPTAPVAAQPQPQPQPTTPEPEAATADAPAVENSAAESVPADDGGKEDSYLFGFYEMLPDFEVVIHEVETPAPRAEDLVEIADPGVYVVQAGSFMAAADAEAQRARLALLGIESRLQRVSIDDRTFHRVRVGPIQDLDELNSIRARLLEGGIDSMIMRMTQ